MKKIDEINKIKNDLMKKIQSEDNKEYHKLSFDEVISLINSSSIKGKYSLWVIKEYLKGNIQRFEDIESRCKQTLILFKNNLSKFTEQQKQLNKMSFQELEMLVEPYQEVLTQNEIKRMNKEKIWSEIDVIYEGPEGRIYIPKTYEASVFLGQGTKWCTTATNNMFEHYNKQGPLYVFITPEKDDEGREKKYQLHWQSNQFMNAEDKSVILDKFNHKKLFAKFLSFFEDNFKKNIILNNLNDDYWLNFLKIDENFVKRNKTLVAEQEVYFFFKKGGLLSSVPEKLLNERIVEISILASSKNLGKVPQKFQNQEFFNRLVNDKISLFKYLPDDFKTKELCEKAMSTNERNIKYLPDKFKTPKLMAEMIKKDINDFCYLPEAFKTHEICLSAVKKRGLNLKYVPWKFRTENFCKIALKEDAEAVKFLPEEFKTSAYLEKFFDEIPEIFDYIDDSKKTEKMNNRVFDMYPRMLDSISDKMMSEKITHRIKTRNFMRNSDENLITRKDCIDIIEFGYLELYPYFPDQFKTPDIQNLLIEKFIQKTGINPNTICKKNKQIMCAIISSTSPNIIHEIKIQKLSKDDKINIIKFYFLFRNLFLNSKHVFDQMILDSNYKIFSELDEKDIKEINRFVYSELLKKRGHSENSIEIIMKKIDFNEEKFNIYQFEEENMDTTAKKAL